MISTVMLALQITNNTGTLGCSAHFTTRETIYD